MRHINETGETMNCTNIVLVGFMGTGKTTVAQALSAKLGWAWIDCDQAIVEREGMSIPDIFAQRGEAAFRAAESAVIESILAKPQQIVATGGGAVMAEHNRRTMKEGGLVIALKATVETIIERVGNDPNRPMLQGNAVEVVPQLLEKRMHAYAFADVSIDTDGLTAVEIADRIVQAAEAFNRS